jgi:hypothetical protein
MAQDMRFVRRKFCWPWDINSEKWSRGVRLVAVMWNDYNQNCVALTPSRPDLCTTAGLRWLPVTALSPTNSAVHDLNSVCRCFVPLWNPEVRLRKLTLWPCTEPGESSLNLHTLFIMQFYIIVTSRACIPGSPQPWDSVIVLNTFLIPPAYYVSHSSRSPWFTSLACSQYVKNKLRIYSLPVGSLFYCPVTTLFVRCGL